MYPLLLDSVRSLQGQVLLNLALNMIKIPSVSGSEKEIMDFVAEHLRKEGIDVELFGRTPDRPNVVATVGSGNSPHVILNGHLDTVPPAAPAQWHTDPFEPILANKQLTGLGALDMKGSCAAMMLVLRALKNFESRLRGTVQLQLVCDEEDNSYFGTPYLIELIGLGKLPRPDYVIVGEYTGLQVMTAERGSFKMYIDFHGQATHTATARVEGRNAIYAAAEAVRLLERDLEIDHPDVGQAIISVNQIRGGTFFSQVPDHCRVQVDRRLVPDETMESVMNGVQALIETLRERIPWLAFDVTPCLDDRGQPRYAAPNVTPRDAPVAEAVRSAHRLVTGNAAQDFYGWFGATDARCFRYEGFDSINYGPVGEHAHGPNEFVWVDSLDTQLAVLTCATADLCGMNME